jgi:hypothetical protein
MVTIPIHFYAFGPKELWGWLFVVAIVFVAYWIGKLIWSAVVGG